MGLFNNLFGKKKNGLSLVVALLKELGRDEVESKLKKMFKEMGVNSKNKLSQDITNLGLALRDNDYTSAASAATKILFEDIKL